MSHSVHRLKNLEGVLKKQREEQRRNNEANSSHLLPVHHLPKNPRSVNSHVYLNHWVASSQWWQL